MSRTILKSMSPQHSGSSTPSTFSNTTNTTWTTSQTSYPASANSDESAPWPPRRYGASLKSPLNTGVETKPSKPKMSPSHNTSSTSHGKLHKRDSSASSLTTPQTASFPNFDPGYPELPSPPAALQDTYTPISPMSTRSKAKLRPLLKKLSSTEKVSLDLSRSAAENEGLGIYTSANTHHRPTDSSSTTNPRSYHHRTTSNTSQISTTTTSSAHRPGAQYIHPMRQAARPYTPPHTHSYQPSPSTSDHSSTSYAPLPPAKRTPPPLHIRTPSTTRPTNPNSTHPSTHPSTPSSLRYQDSTSYPLPDPTSIPALPPTTTTARSSLDSTLRSTKRSRTNTTTTLDQTAADLAAVHALRAKFNADERAKDERYAAEMARARVKEERRRERRDESLRRKSEARERKGERERSLPASEKEMEEVGVGVGLEARGKRGRAGTAASASKAVSNRWSLFWWRFRTMWLRLKRSMGGGEGS